MRARVDAEECISCGLCEDTCGEVFEMDGSVAVVKSDPVPVDVEASCREAAECCPVECIVIEE